MTDLSRRGFLASLAVCAGASVAHALPTAAAPKESGLSSEGLLVGQPGFQSRTVMSLRHTDLPRFLSRAQLAAHHADYVKAVERLQDTERRLQDASLDATRYGSLRRGLVAAANDVLLHEFYFGNLAPEKMDLPGRLQGHMRAHMGSLESWRADFTRCALEAKAWAVLIYDPYDDRWHDAVMDADQDGVWVGGNPLVVCYVADHAFATDYGSREAYVAKFLDHIDWTEVGRRYAAVDRM